MSLNSFYFIIYFVALFVAMIILQLLRKVSSKIFSRVQILFLLAFSIYFIASSDYRFLICIIAVTIISYLFGLLISKEVHKRLFLIGGVSL